MNPTRLLLVLVVLLTLGGGAWLLLSSDHQPAPAPEEPTPATTPDAKAPGTGTLVAEPGKTDAPAVPVRKTVEVDTSGRESPQGVKGIVLSPSGAPEPNCKVFLVESAAGTEIFRMMQLAQRGITLPPVASTSTDAKGAFALGIQAPDPARVYEVRILSGTYADFTHPGVRLIEGNWYDAGSLQLLNGIAVTGQVTVAGGGGMPIADAEVSIRATQQFEVSIVPGRERGIVVK